MTKTFQTETGDGIKLGGTVKIRVADGYRGMRIGKQHHIPELVIKRKKPIKKVLILPAHPGLEATGYFPQEVRRFSVEMLNSPQQERWEIYSQSVSNLKELRWLLLEQEPHVVHFMGNGVPPGLFLQDGSGCPISIPPAILSGTFELCAATVECVILSSAYSPAQAEAIGQHIDYVIGLPHPYHDHFNRYFLPAFYNAWAADQEIGEAFACATQTLHSHLPSLASHQAPVLKSRKICHPRTQNHARL